MCFANALLSGWKRRVIYWVAKTAWVVSHLTIRSKRRRNVKFWGKNPCLFAVGKHLCVAKNHCCVLIDTERKNTCFYFENKYKRRLNRDGKFDYWSWRVWGQKKWKWEWLSFLKALFLFQQIYSTPETVSWNEWFFNGNNQTLKWFVSAITGISQT